MGYYAGVKMCAASVASTRSELAALNAKPMELSALVEPSSGLSVATCGKAKDKCDELECCSGLACTEMYASPPYFAGVKTCEPNGTKSNATRSCAADSSSCEEEECCAGLTCKTFNANPPYYAGVKMCAASVASTRSELAALNAKPMELSALVEPSSGLSVATCGKAKDKCDELECCSGLACTEMYASPPYFAGVKTCEPNGTKSNATRS